MDIVVTKLDGTYTIIREEDISLVKSEESQQDWNDLGFKESFKDGWDACWEYIKDRTR